MANKTPRDPAWWPIVDRFYSALLYLYPPDHRKEYADCMRQALRDRCREAGQGRVSPLCLLAVELLPDLAGSLWEEHTMSFAGSSHRRVLGWAGALGLLAIAISNAGLASDWMYRNYSPRALAWRQSEEAMAWQQGKLQGFLAYLEAQQTPRAMALRLALAPGDQTRGEPDEFTPLHAGDRARIQEQVTHLLQGPLDETALVALASACRSSAACDDRELASRMREDQSGNGYALLWSFEASRKMKDSAGMQLALQRMADAPRFSEPKQLLMRELILQRRAYGGDDTGLDAALFDRSLAFMGAPLHGVVDSCRRMAGLVDTCRRVSERLLHAGGLRERIAGARLAYALAATEAERDVAQEQYRQAAWLADHFPPPLWDSPQWHQAHGAKWLEAWQHADSEVEALVAWQQATNVAPRPPHGYELTPARRRILVVASR